MKHSRLAGSLRNAAPMDAPACQIALSRPGDIPFGILSAQADRIVTVSEAALSRGLLLCLERAKRDLFQCLAVAKPNYEDIFCMGRHEMAQPAACVAAGAGVELPPEPAPPPPPAKPASGHRKATAHRRTHAT